MESFNSKVYDLIADILVQQRDILDRLRHIEQEANTEMLENQHDIIAALKKLEDQMTRLLIALSNKGLIK